MSLSPSLFVRCTRTATVALSFALVVGCSSKKAKEESPALTGDASHDAKPPPPKPPECRSPAPVTIVFDPSETGFTSCDGQVWHRSSVHACPTRLPRTTECGFAPVDGGTLNGSCRVDGDCTTKAKGYCGVTSANASCHCDYGCTEDADCGDGNVCQCGDPLGKCVPATCKSDDECGGLLCLRSNNTSCGQTYACQAPTDECTSNSDCKPPLSACTLENGHRTCQAIGSCK
jgi:hypothetical protein